MAVLATREQRTALLADLYWAAVTAAAPGPALSAALASHPSEPKRRVHLLALGKAAYPMAVAAVAALRSATRISPEACSSLRNQHLHLILDSASP